MAINVNQFGRVLSVTKVMIGDVEETLEGIDAAGVNAQYFVLRGASGNDVLVNADGTLGINDLFSGEVYENEHTMLDDDKYRFETTEKILRSGVVLISTFDVLVGDTSNQRYPKSSGSSLAVEFLDLSELYFKNAGAGNNVKINIIGVLA